MLERMRAVQAGLVHSVQMLKGLNEFLLAHRDGDYPLPLLQCRSCGHVAPAEALESRIVGRARDDEGEAQYACPDCDRHEFAEVD